MKKLLLLLTVFALCYGCEQAPGNPETPITSEEPTLIGTWRTINEYYSVVVDGPEEIKNELEKEISEDIANEEESYMLTFREDGAGSSSEFYRNIYDILDHYSSTFKWQFSDDTLILTDGIGDHGLFVTKDGHACEEITWTVEEFTIDKLVLSFVSYVLVDNETGGWEETHTHRYTFEKVE